MKVDNYQTLLSKYDCLSWDKLSQFIDKLRKELREEIKCSMVEGQSSVSSLWRAVLNISGATACIRATAVAMRMSSWLQYLGIPMEEQAIIKDFSFEGNELLNYAPWKMQGELCTLWASMHLSEGENSYASSHPLDSSLCTITISSLGPQSCWGIAEIQL